MTKDAYWFKHDSNAKDDPKCIILIEELGLEGYGIFWVLIETLRDQPELEASLRILPAIARRYNTSFEKVKSVVFRYELFSVVDDKFFFSESLKERMKPLMEKKERNSISGIKGNLIKYKYATKEELEGMSNEEILRLNDNKRLSSGGESGGDRYKRREEKKREENINYVQYVDFWNSVYDCNLRITDSKRKQIRARLRTYTKEELEQAIKNRSKDEWINGEGKKYRSNWDSFWRNDEKPERYLKQREGEFNPEIAKLRKNAYKQ